MRRGIARIQWGDRRAGHWLVVIGGELRDPWPEPLTMFRPEEREGFEFKWIGVGRMDGVVMFQTGKSQRLPSRKLLTVLTAVEPWRRCRSAPG